MCDYEQEIIHREGNEYVKDVQPCKSQAVVVCALINPQHYAVKLCARHLFQWVNDNGWVVDEVAAV